MQNSTKIANVVTTCEF